MVKHRYIEENNRNKHLVFTSTDANKKVLTKFANFWNEIKHLIEAINDDKNGKYGKYLIKIRFNSDDNLPLNKMLKLHKLTVIVKSLFEENGKYYPQVFLDECLCDV